MSSEVGRLNTDVVVQGDQSLTPLVLLHGFTGDTTTWTRLASQMHTSRTVLAVDMVGHGDSPAPPDPGAYTMAAAVDAVRRAVRSAMRDVPGSPGGIPPACHCLGYSMGGRVALNLALTAPREVASLVLVGASPGMADETARRERVEADGELATFIEAHGIEAFVDRWMSHPLFASQGRLGSDYLAASRAQRLRNDPAALALVLRGMGTGAMVPVWDRLDEIGVPVLLVNGALDAKFDGLARDMAVAIPHAERLAVPGSGHAVHVEAPAALAEAVAEFLDRVDRGRAGV